MISDLHCHILPGVDDGAENVEMAEALLREEHSQGVRQIMFTPHFYANKMTQADFLRRRISAAKQIARLCEEFDIAGALGAEVRLEPELLDMDLAPLALADTGYILLEWPFMTYPLWGKDVVARAQDSGLRPVFAHIERYDYFFPDPEQLGEYIAQGVLCQMNATALLNESTQKQALRLIREGYVHVLSSDAHNMAHRPPRLGAAFDLVQGKLGKKTAEQLKQNAGDVFCGRELNPPQPGRKKHFWSFG